MKKDDYADLLDLERPTFQNHPPMPRADRAVQFQPFAALTGFEEAIEQAQEEYERRQEEKENEH